MHIQSYMYIYLYTYMWHMHDFSQAKAFKEQANRLPLVTLPRSGFVFGIHPNDENQNPRPAQHQFFAPEIKSVKSGPFSYWNLQFPVVRNHSLTVFHWKGKTQCFILSFSMEIGLFLAGWSNGWSWIRSPLSTEWGCTTQHTLLAWCSGKSIHIASSTKMENLCHRPLNPANQPYVWMLGINSLKGTFWKQIRGKIPDFQFDWKRRSPADSNVMEKANGNIPWNDATLIKNITDRSTMDNMYYYYIYIYVYKNIIQ